MSDGRSDRSGWDGMGDAAHRAVRVKLNQNKGAKGKTAYRPVLLHFARMPRFRPTAGDGAGAVFRPSVGVFRCGEVNAG